jgi:hypothetical protein
MIVTAFVIRKRFTNFIIIIVIFSDAVFLQSAQLDNNVGRLEIWHTARQEVYQSLHPCTV